MIHLRQTASVLLLGLALFMLQPAAAQSPGDPLPELSLSQLEEQIEAGELGKIRALAIEQGGEIIYRKRFGKGELGDRVDIKSAGKSITAIAVGMVIADGGLAGTDVKVWPYLDASRGAPFDDITVGDLLTMSSALDCNDWEPNSPGQEERMYRTRVWRDFALALPAREYERDEDGDGPFSYCTAGVFLLGQVVQKATGERFDQFVQRRLFDPLGIDGADWRRSRSGEVQSGGQLTISDEALIKLGRMVLDEGRWNGEQIVPPEQVKDMLTARHQLSQHVHYAQLWWLEPVRTSRGYEAAWMMKGNGGNMVVLVPTLDAVLVVQAENYNKRTATYNAHTALRAMTLSIEVPSDD